MDFEISESVGFRFRIVNRVGWSYRVGEMFNSDARAGPLRAGEMGSGNFPLLDGLLQQCTDCIEFGCKLC